MISEFYGFYGYSSFGAFGNGAVAGGARGVIPENAIPMAPVPAMPDARGPQMASGAFGGYSGTVAKMPAPLKKVTRVRQEFPESWIWADIQTWYTNIIY